jgi:hypothetical protein
VLTPTTLTDRDRLRYKNPPSASSMCTSVTITEMTGHLRRNAQHWINRACKSTASVQLFAGSLP